VSNATIGVLALQGDFALHCTSLKKLNVLPVLVRMPRDLVGLDGLILPGGESTALLKLARPIGLFDTLKDFAQSGKHIFGTCAGAILLAEQVTNPEQESLALIHITIERNGYGRQLDSMDVMGEMYPPLGNGALPMAFIRAPKIIHTKDSVRVLARYKKYPVLVEEGTILAATYHPELTDNLDVYAYWLQCIGT
jgi:5'-phosphate synthase pdxT subunit